MAYESPINLIMQDINYKYEQNVLTAIQNIGVEVNKDELIKALAYDRQQYERGYQEGYAQAVTDLISQFTSIREDQKEE